MKAWQIIVAFAMITMIWFVLVVILLYTGKHFELKWVNETSVGTGVTVAAVSWLIQAIRHIRQ